MEQHTEQPRDDEPRAHNDNRRRITRATKAVASIQIPLTRLEKLRGAHPSKKIALALMAAAAILTMIIGFNWGGWVSGKTAQELAAAGAQDAVAARLAPICVAQFNLDPDRVAKLDELKAIGSSWQRPSYVEEQGWATMPGESSPDSKVASASALLLMAG